ncbi:uncharacterized protein DS421_15g513680 [Arachis hypogaea]|nr:uncharacterized protein DS421_15g513680 [Arachis hypogaea]
MCFHSLKEDESSYYYSSCDIYPNTHVTRFCIHLRVSNDIDSALFIVYDKEASKFLGTTASDLRFSQDSWGVNKNVFPAEINSFKCKKVLFKVYVKLDDINTFQLCMITVLKLNEDKSLMPSFAAKHKIYDEISSQSCEIITSDGNDDFVTPKRTLIATGWSEKLLDVFPDSGTGSSSKTRKISELYDCAFRKEHADE